jgi:hypothetical protein
MKRFTLKSKALPRRLITSIFLCSVFTIVSAGNFEVAAEVRAARSSCDASIISNLNKALPDLILRQNKKMQKHIDFYEKMKQQDYLPPSFKKKVERAIQAIAELTDKCATPDGCEKKELKLLKRSERVVEQSAKKSAKGEIKYEKRICSADKKWHKVEDRIEKFAKKCSVGEPSYELHPVIPSDVDCSQSHGGGGWEFPPNR